MNERHIAHDLIACLDESAGQLDAGIAKRLHASRQKALGVQRAAEARLSLAGIGASVGTKLWDETLSFTRGWVGLLALVVCAAVTQYYGHVQKQEEVEEVDSALLIDDLPIDAYLDRGFGAWLKNSSES